MLKNSYIHRLIILGFFITLSSGCASKGIGNKDVIADAPPLNIPLTLFPKGDYSLSQMMTIDYSGTVYRSLIEVEKKGDRIVFVGMGELGQTLFSFIIDNNEITLSGNIQGLKPFDMINDFLITFTSIERLLPELKKQGFHLTESPNGLQRKLYYNEVIAEQVSYSVPDKYRSTIQLINNFYGYQLEIVNSEHNKTDVR